MSLPTTVAEVIDRHVKFTLESVDRMYLNVYQQMLQRGGGVSVFFRQHRQEACATALVMSRMTKVFVSAVERFAEENKIPIVSFERGVRKEDVFHKHLQQFQSSDGVVMIGKSQEKATVYRTTKRRCERTGRTYPWLIKTTAMVNHYYFYCVDPQFGPFFIKFCSYFPYNAKLCLNGHEYAKRQLLQQRVGFEAYDNAIVQCDDPAALQRMANGLSAAKVEVLLDRWLKRLPQPFTAADQRAGFCYRLSILQVEFSRTQVFERPLAGRVFFERVIRDNLDLGRPKNVQLIFDRRIQKNTPSRFRTRVMTQGVVPSLWIDYKSSTIKQYFKQGRALRTETTINNTRDFGIGRKIENLPALRKMAQAANRRLLDVQRLDHDPAIGQDRFDALTRPSQVEGQRASGLKFGDPTVTALFSALLMFRLLVRGFSHKDLRSHVAQFLARTPDEFTSGQTTYHLRRLRLKGLIVRKAKSNRYQVTSDGLEAALLYVGGLSLIIRPIASHSHANSQMLERIATQIAPLIADVCRLAA
jgi:hypothetical protein